MAVDEARVGEAPNAAESGIPEERLVKAVGGPSTDRCGCGGGEDGDAPRHRADAESTPDRFHAHHGADPIRATQGEDQGQPSAERRAHHVRGVDAEAVEHLGDPSGLVVGVADRCSVLPRRADHGDALRPRRRRPGGGGLPDVPIVGWSHSRRWGTVASRLRYECCVACASPRDSSFGAGQGFLVRRDDSAWGGTSCEGCACNPADVSAGAGYNDSLG
jgi:hypothetical protein